MLERWLNGVRQVFGGGTPSRAPHEAIGSARFVVVDTETTGLDPARADLLSIGACEVEAGQLKLGRVFEVLVRNENVSARENVLVHGIGHGAQRAAEDPAAALADWLAFCGTPVFAGFHAQFDAVVLARCVAGVLGSRLPTDWLDVRVLLCALGTSPRHAAFGLDEWLAHYGIGMRGRHGAAADAVATAQLLMIALEHLRRARGVTTVRALRKVHAAALERLSGAGPGGAGF